MLDTGSAKVAGSGERTALFERDGKSFFPAHAPEQLILSFGSPPSGNGKPRAKGSDLNALRNTISSYLFEYIEEFRIATWFVNKLSATEMTVKKAEEIPLVVNVLNRDDGTLHARFGAVRGLEFPVIEHTFLSGAGPAWVNEYHVYALRIATPEEFKQMNRMAAKVNAVIRGLCDRRRLALGSCRLRFGRLNGQIILCDELSPFTCRFLDAGAEDQALDRFQPARDDAAAAIAELCDRFLLKV